MNSTIKISLAAALLTASSSVPVLAQRHDSRQGVRQAPHAAPVQSRKSAHYREVSVTRGHKWRKGQRLAKNQQRYVVSDWNQRGLRAPPRGYRWVREDNNSGDFLLVAAATGLIASILSQ